MFTFPGSFGALHRDGSQWEGRAAHHESHLPRGALSLARKSARGKLGVEVVGARAQVEDRLEHSAQPDLARMRERGEDGGGWAGGAGFVGGVLVAVDENIAHELGVEGPHRADVSPRLQVLEGREVLCGG